MSIMSIFEEKLVELFARNKTSLYQVALSVGQDPSRVDKIIFLKRPATFETRLETIQKLADSPLIDADFGQMASWLAQDYLPRDVILRAAKNIQGQAS